MWGRKNGTELPLPTTVRATQSALRRLPSLRTIVFAALGVEIIFFFIMMSVRVASDDNDDEQGAATSMLLRGRTAKEQHAESLLLTHGRAPCKAPPPDYEEEVLVGGQWSPAVADDATAEAVRQQGLSGSYFVASYAPPIGSCVRWRTAQQARQLLKGKHLMFIGDSVWPWL